MFIQYKFGRYAVDNEDITRYLVYKNCGRKEIYCKEEIIRIIITSTQTEDWINYFVKEENCKTLEELIEKKLNEFNFDLVKALDDIFYLDELYDFASKEEKKEIERYFLDEALEDNDISWSDYKEKYL